MIRLSLWDAYCLLFCLNDYFNATVPSLDKVDARGKPDFLPDTSVNDSSIHVVDGNTFATLHGQSPVADEYSCSPVVRCIIHAGECFFFDMLEIVPWRNCFILCFASGRYIEDCVLYDFDGKLRIAKKWF